MIEKCAKKHIEILKKELCVKGIAIFEKQVNCKMFEVYWNKEKKGYVIYCPSDTSLSFYKLDLLHEYVHIHQSCRIAVGGIKNPRIRTGDHSVSFHLYANNDHPVQTYRRVASDWFVDGEIAMRCKKDLSDQITYCFEKVTNDFSSDYSDCQYLKAGLIFAEGRKWCKQTKLNNDIKLNRIVNCFEKVDPTELTVKSICELTVSLFNSLDTYIATLKSDNDGFYVDIECNKEDERIILDSKNEIDISEYFK